MSATRTQACAQDSMMNIKDDAVLSRQKGVGFTMYPQVENTPIKMDEVFSNAS